MPGKHPYEEMRFNFWVVFFVPAKIMIMPLKTPYIPIKYPCEKETQNVTPV